MDPIIATCRGGIVAACFASGLFVLQLTPTTALDKRSLFGTVKHYAEDVKRAEVLIEGPRGRTAVTTDSGQFEIELHPDLKPGTPIILQVKKWIIFDPYSQGQRGRLFLPDQSSPQAEPIHVQVRLPGEPDLLSAAGIKPVLEEKASILDLKALPARGDELASVSRADSARTASSSPLIQSQAKGVYFASLQAPAEEPPEPPAAPASTTPGGPAPEEGSQATQLVAVSAPPGFLKAKAAELGFSEEQLRSAIDEFSKAARDPYARGLAALHERRYAEASSEIRESLETASDKVAKLISLATAEVEQQNYEAAKAALIAAGGIRSTNTTLLNNLGVVLTVVARYQFAKAALERALAINEIALGADAPETARNIANLALLYRVQGKSEEAEAYSRRALTIAEKTYGPKHPAVAVALRSLAEAYTLAMRYPEAQVAAQRALTIDEEQFGPVQVYVAADLATLAAIKIGQAKFEEAEQLQERALAIRSREEPPRDDLDAARDNHRLALIYAGLGRHPEAAPLLEKVRETYERVFGPEHPRVAEVLDDLGSIYFRPPWHMIKSERYLRRAVKIDEKALGPDHPELAVRLEHLGLFLLSRYQYSSSQLKLFDQVEAEKLLERAVSIYETALGPRHPRLARALFVLGYLHDRPWRHARAEQEFSRAVAIVAEQHQPLRLANYRHALAKVYDAQGKYKEAEAELLKALSDRVAAAGPYDPDVADLDESLAKTLKKLGRAEEAERYKKQAAEIRAHRP